jgi:ABC-2 type transport system permease protein
MNRIGIVMRRDYRELRQSAAFRIMIIIAAIITVAAATGISVGLSLQSWLDAPEAGPLLELFIGLVLYFLPFIILLAFVWTFGNLPVTREKVNGNVDSLMATPLSPRDLWLGKSLAIFVPGYIVSILATAVVVLAVNLSVIVPATGQFVLPPASLVLGLVVSPLTFLGLALLIILISMINNPEIALAPSLVIGFGLMMGMPVGMGMGYFDIASWPFTLWYLGGTLALIAVTLGFTRLLTRQNIVLSSKGG